MNTSRALNVILLILSTAIFLISIGYAFWGYSHSDNETLIKYYFTFGIMFFLIGLYEAIGMIKIEKKEISQVILCLSIIIMTIINLFVSPRGTFNIIFNPCVVAIYSINFAFHLIRISLERVKQKVDFVPMKPIIKP